ncbi:hypothetical protein QKW60_01590 [Defluviimonas aestuarii]|uniref:hypothetical protein n=1 Tax=Albidovulum aestuarii TaxID=1130726 RepID=UPI00249A8312|nr:hypothetical protein [Defluviimonas aestuarii]MDI3335086.1 hypothetical protein [Defluviimonas aestuarii]
MTEVPQRPTEIDCTATSGPASGADDVAGLEGADLPVACTGHARILTEEHWEVVKADLLPLFMERRTLSEISEAFGVSVNTAGAWRARLIEDLRKEASGMQARDYVMDCISSLRLARAEAWRTVRESTTAKDRRAGLQLVTQIENQSVKLGAMIGLYGNRIANPLQPVAGEVDENVRRIQDMMLALLGGLGTITEQSSDVIHSETLHLSGEAGSE